MTNPHAWSKPLGRGWLEPDLLLDLAPVAFIVTDEQGLIRDVNAAAGALLGFDARHLRLQEPLSLFVADSRALRRLIARAARADDPTPLEAELVVVARDGRRRHTAVTARPFRDERDVLWILWVLVDVDARVTAETEIQVLADELEGRAAERAAELEAQHARLEAILDGMPAGVIVASAPSGQVLITNDQAEAMLRRPIAVSGIAEYDQVPGFDESDRRLEPEDWPLARALMHGESIQGERIRIERDDGTTITVEANANPIFDAKGRVASAVVVFWDVSERERRERAEREFITNAAHELQTPVASIVSAVEVLLAGAKDEPDDRERFLGHLDRESARLVRILRSLLAISRTQLGYEPIDLTPVRVRPLLDRIALALQPRRGIEVVVRCPARLTVLSHDELLEQAVGNLAANSARHTAVGRIVLSAARRPEGVRIEVSDTGSGIDPDDVERLFERFTRGRGRDAEGFGLGLAIVRQIMTVLGGTVSLAPRRGGGTVARIVLPETGRAEP